MKQFQIIFLETQELEQQLSTKIKDRNIEIRVQLLKTLLEAAKKDLDISKIFSTFTYRDIKQELLAY
jgi:hypothetical protein